MHRIKLIPKMLRGDALKEAVKLLRRFRNVQWDLTKARENRDYTKSVLVRDTEGKVNVKDVNTQYRRGIPEYKHLTKELYDDLMRLLEYLRMQERTLGDGIYNATRAIEEILSHEVEIGKLRTREEVKEAAKCLAIALGSATVGAGGYYLYDKYHNPNNDSYDNYVEQRPDEDLSAPNFENWED